MDGPNPAASHEDNDSFLAHEGPKSNRKRSRLRSCFCKPMNVVIVAVAFVILYTIVFTLAVMLVVKRRDESDQSQLNITRVKGVVVTDHETCSDIGRDMLNRGGSAVDAAIAALICVGLMSPYSAGIGGGHFMLTYNARNRKSTFIDARETAPAAAHPEMFLNTSLPFDATTIGVPGEILGFWEAHQREGRLPWRELFQPTILLAENGHHMSAPTNDAVQLLNGRVDLKSIPGFCENFCFENSEMPHEGYLLRRPKFANTLRQIADYGPKYIYQGKIPRLLSKEIQNKGGILTEQDFENYKVKVREAVVSNIGDFQLVTTGAPSGGPVLTTIMRMLNDLALKPQDLANTKRTAYLLHLLAETFKLSYGKREQLADPDYIPEVKKLVSLLTSETFAQHLVEKIPIRSQNADYYTNDTFNSESRGTTHVCVLSPDGDAVSATSTINFYFGSLVFSETTGILWNNEMMDFSFPLPDKPYDTNHPNRISPGKRPLSSMAPAILLDKEGMVNMVVGGAGGSKITTSVAQVMAYLLWLGDSPEVAMRRKRFHTELFPMFIQFEEGFPQDLQLELLKTFHHLYYSKPGVFSVIQLIHRNSTTGELRGVSDDRKISGRASYVTQMSKVYT